MRSKFFYLFSIWMFIWLPFLYQTAQAKDFGIQGHTFPIIEEDILEVIKKNLEKIDLQKLNQKMHADTQKYVERPTAVTGITKARESREYFYDPTYVVEKDIRDHLGNLIHSAGTKVNPLEHTSLTEDLVFIDGDDERQVNFAINKSQKNKIILVKGSPLKLQKKHKKWIYFDQAGFLIKHLGITEVPAIISQDGLRLKINIVGGLL